MKHSRTKHMWLLSTWNVASASATEELIFFFNVFDFKEITFK